MNAPPAPRDGFCQIATADILVVLADVLKRAERILVREGFEGDLRSVLQSRFDQCQGLSNHTDLPGYDAHYRAIQDLFWHFYAEAEKNLRVLDDPEGHA